MSADTILCLLFLLSALGALYLILSLIRVGRRFTLIINRLERAHLKAEASGNLAEATQLAHILAFLKMESEGEPS